MFDWVCLVAEESSEQVQEEIAWKKRSVKELLKQKTGAPDREYMRLKAHMETEFARLKVARKYKQRGIRIGDLK